jgi:hypothetical protein
MPNQQCDIKIIAIVWVEFQLIISSSSLFKKKNLSYFTHKLHYKLNYNFFIIYDNDFNFFDHTFMLIFDLNLDHIYNKNTCILLES